MDKVRFLIDVPKRIEKQLRADAKKKKRSRKAHVEAIIEEKYARPNEPNESKQEEANAA